MCQTARPIPTALPGTPLDFEAMPALFPGRCNWCGGKLARHQIKLCSDACRKHWDREMRVLGHKLAERALAWVAGRRLSPKPAAARRGFSELEKLTREFLRRRREMIEAVAAAEDARS